MQPLQHSAGYNDYEDENNNDDFLLFSLFIDSAGDTPRSSRVE